MKAMRLRVRADGFIGSVASSNSLCRDKVLIKDLPYTYWKLSAASERRWKTLEMCRVCLPQSL